MRRLNVPIGVSDFKTLREHNQYYIDKTAFVREVLEAAPQVLLFPRPRRFGKTLNMSMLRYFLERSAEERAPLFEGLAAMRDGVCRKHFQRYPVIHARLAEVWGLEKEAPLATLREEVRRLYDAHRYLLADGALEPDEAARFRQILESKGSEAMLCSALLDLSQLLHRFHRERVVILVDEYDAPLHSSVMHPSYGDTVSLIRRFLIAGVKDNPHLLKAVLTGVLRVSNESIFSGLNNITTYSILHSDFATWFGFTEEDARKLLEDAEVPEQIDLVRTWYQGYLFGERSIYNPWSLLHFVNQGDLRPRGYWANGYTDDIPEELAVRWGIEYHDDFQRLLRNKTIRKRIVDHIALRTLKEHPEAVWSIMAMAGYLRAEPIKKAHTGSPVCRLSFPNREVKEAFPGMFKHWMFVGLGERGLADLEVALIEGNAESLTDLLERFLLKLSHYDRAPKEPEALYHAFVMGLLVLLDGRFDVRSNRESGYGRYDIMMLPKRAGQPGVVLEIKVLNTPTTAVPDEAKVEAALEGAFEQIRQGFYTHELHERGADPIQAVAIVFHGKRVWVRAQRSPSTKPPARRPKRARRGPQR